MMRAGSLNFEDLQGAVAYSLAGRRVMVSCDSMNEISTGTTSNAKMRVIGTHGGVALRHW
jgi:hypothetical protein